MNSSLQVILLCLGMFLGTTGIGLIPTLLRSSKASSKTINGVSVYGAGLLVGAALIVVIPEAIKVIVDATSKKNVILHTAGDDEHAYEEGIMREDVAFWIGLSVVSGFTVMLIIDESFKMLNHHQKVRKHQEKSADGL